MMYILIGLALVLAFVVMTYNKLISKIEWVNNSKKQIDVQLDRRFKVFESLINVVRKVMDYEQTVLKDVVELRSQATSARKSGDEKEQIKAENEISKIASQINLVFEQYPQLSALENAKQLQEEIISTENKLSFAKQAYNDALESYNASKKSFFTSMIVSMFKSKLDKNHEYWGLSEARSAELEDATVKL